MPKLPSKVLNLSNPLINKGGPLWTGPDGEGDNGGVTQGLISKFLCCRERFRLLVVEGVRPKERFNPRTEYGSMWHICEEALASETAANEGAATDLAQSSLQRHCRQLAKQYPFDRDLIAHWGGLAATFFPRYVKHWQDHPDVKDRKPLLQEHAFDVPYTLPSGRKVRLRGRWDSVDLIDGGIWLQENKTKSTINLVALHNQLSSGFDLQTMLYLVALHKWKDKERGYDGVKEQWRFPIRGVRYNVIRRPAHKSIDNALKKFNEDCEDNRVGEWFARLQVKISPKDIERFCKECLDPVLEMMYDWYDFTALGIDPFTPKTVGQRQWMLHFRMPFGIYNPLLEGAPTDLDRMVQDGDMTGMERTKVLYPELQS